MFRSRSQHAHVRLDCRRVHVGVEHQAREGKHIHAVLVGEVALISTSGFKVMSGKTRHQTIDRHSAPWHAHGI